ncbi:MAG: hypothetical protein HY078_10465 [Elusimicrobia bacterium]|nr:hypothetical protein [Elusimicrobiota bacterium]
MEPATGAALIAGLKALNEIVKGRKDPDASSKLLEIQSQVFDLVNENQAMRQENAVLKEQLALRQAVELRDDGAIWRKGDQAGHEFGGFCPNCNHEQGKLIKLGTEPRGIPIRRTCSVCKFQIKGQWWK